MSEPGGVELLYFRYFALKAVSPQIFAIIVVQPFQTRTAHREQLDGGQNQQGGGPKHRLPLEDLPAVSAEGWATFTNAASMCADQNRLVRVIIRRVSVTFKCVTANCKAGAAQWH